MMILPLILLLLLAAPQPARARGGVEYSVRPDGDDDGPGVLGQPFRTLGRCSAAMQAGAVDATCEVGAGTYRETVQLPQSSAHALTFRAAPGTRPVLSGLEVLAGLTWTRGAGSPCSWVAELPPGAPTSFQQLFYGGKMMVEARWPNVDVENLEADMLNRSVAWEPAGSGSQYGFIADPELARGNFSWDGALATLNVAHQFFTWTRTVANHTAGIAVGDRLSFCCTPLYL